jgi:microsomal dipeptidase-like Zn-dependent dipeptidase
MTARRRAAAVATGLCVLGFAHACTISVAPGPSLPASQSPSVTGTLSTDDVWGVADLHAHPAAHLAFGGLGGEAGLLWGDPGLPGGRMTYVSGGDLPDIPPCDPEIHEANVSDEVSRFTRGLVFQNLTKVTNYPHASHGGPTGDPEAYAAWPNGRDILHQVMNIQSIRRAYDGGLRLMFASTVEAQILAFAMHATIFPTPFVPTRQVERASAEAQLQYIQAMASANADWMQIASTPEQAESAIRSGRLALVLAIENDGLLLADVQQLVATYGVGAIVPVHLVDNDVGGTAASGDLFNSATSLEGIMFGFPNRFISVEPDPTLDFHLGWPVTLTSDAVAYGLNNVPYSTASALGYSQYPECIPVGVGVDPRVGERNSVGLRAPQNIRALMAMGMLIDLAHMGFRSTSDTIDLAVATCGYPLLDTHTNVHASGGSERDLYLQHAAYVSSSSGVMGFGSGQSRTAQRTAGSDAQGFNIIASARGGPLVSLSGGSAQPTIIEFPRNSSSGYRACTAPLTGDATNILILVTSSGSLMPGDVAYARIGFDDGTESTATIRLDGTANHVGPLPESIARMTWMSINVVNQQICQYSDGPVSIHAVTVEDESGVPLVSIHPGDLGLVAGTSPQSIATLGDKRSTFQVYLRCPSGDPSICDAAEQYLPPMTPSTLPDEHLQIRMTSGAESLQTASALIQGASVAASLCYDPTCSDAPDPCKSPQFMMTRAGGWPNATALDAYYRIPRGDVPPSYQAIEICLTEPDLVREAWELDSVSVTVVVDPTRLWTGDYGNYLHQLFHDRSGAIALGTDMNGLAEQFPFADFRPEYMDSDAGAECSQASATGTAKNPGNEQYGDDQSGGTFTLQRPLRIGTTTSLCLPDRGLATYGMLPELFDAIYHYNPSVYRSLFQSARATIEAWRAARARAAQFATAPESCPDGGAPQADIGATELVACAPSDAGPVSDGAEPDAANGPSGADGGASNDAGTSSEGP